MAQLSSATLKSNTVAISVIISTYNSEVWLEKVLWGYEAQTFVDFEVVIADDGSKQPTFDLIEKMKSELRYPIKHIWQEDEGFQKSRILNKAIVACDAEYIVMSDGDCIPRCDFLEVHLMNKEKGYFLSGGYFMLPMDISKLISKDDILSQQCFDVKWLKSQGLKPSFKNNKLKAKGLFQGLLNFLTPTKATWNGHNASGWKSDILAVNGFDERMQYGGQDRELGERLFNLGIKSKQIRYSAVCIHLDHKRGYKTQESISKNLAIRKKTVFEKIIRTPFGIVKE
jgi:glycosyltransferase involved in cell wall biosynthesis